MGEEFDPRYHPTPSVDTGKPFQVGDLVVVPGYAKPGTVVESTRAFVRVRMRDGTEALRNPAIVAHYREAVPVDEAAADGPDPTTEPTCRECRAAYLTPHKLSCSVGGAGAVRVPLDEAAARKGRPLARGVLDYFPDALQVVAEVSRVGNEQHHPGAPLHWEKDKSTDHADCLLRHLTDRGTQDTDGVSHTAKVAWRALALLQTELEAADPELHARRETMRQAAAKGERT